MIVFYCVPFRAPLPLRTSLPRPLRTNPKRFARGGPRSDHARDSCVVKSSRVVWFGSVYARFGGIYDIFSLQRLLQKMSIPAIG
jgi:hypothetical protein